MQSKFQHTVACSIFILLQWLIIPISHAASAQPATLRNLALFLQQLQQNHPRLMASQAELEAARARSRAASRPLYNPELELDGERLGLGNNRDKVDTTTLAINQTIDWHNKRAARKNVAYLAQQVSTFEQQNVRQQFIAEVFSALADYQLQRELIQAHQQRLALANQLQTQANQLYKAGDISKLDLEQIRLITTQTQLTLNQAKTALTSKLQALLAITGKQNKNWPSLPYTPPPLQADKLHYETLLASLPSLKAATTRVAQARSLMRLRVREQKADPTVGVRVGAENADKLVGLTLSIPLNIRNNYQAEVDEARAELRRAESQLENQRLQLKARLQAAAQRYQLNRSSWQSWQKVANSSLRKQSHLLLRLWRAGELSTSDYLVQLKQIREAELNTIELKATVWKAWFDWLAVSNRFEQWLAGK